MKNIMTAAFLLLIALILTGLYLLGAFSFPGEPKFAKLHLGSHVFDIEVRDTMAGRSQGLSGRETLGEREGMLFSFGKEGKYGFWMKDMKFPIDIVWLRGTVVVGVTENVPPEPEKSIFSLTTHYPPEPVDKVLEFPAGTAARYGVKAGDMLDFDVQ